MIALATAWPSLPAFAAAAQRLGIDRHVSPGGVDAGDCSLAHGCATIPYAIDRMNDGDTLLIADGRYSSGFATGLTGCVLTGSAHIALDAADSCPVTGCTIRALNVTDPPSVILDGSQMGVYAVDASNWRIEGIELNTEPLTRRSRNQTGCKISG